MFEGNPKCLKVGKVSNIITPVTEHGKKFGQGLLSEWQYFFSW